MLSSRASWLVAASDVSHNLAQVDRCPPRVSRNRICQYYATEGLEARCDGYTDATYGVPGV